jgi:hypothetical protein
MRDRCTSTAAVIVASAFLLAAAVALLQPVPAFGEGSLCLSSDDAGIAMSAAVVIVLPGKYVGGTNCEYKGAPKKGAAPRKILATWVSAKGTTPSIEGLKSNLCKLAKLLETSGSKKSCAYAKAALKEHNPVRLVRLLYALSNHSGTAFDISGRLGGNPGYVWTPDSSTGISGSIALFYEQDEDRFVTAVCSAIYVRGGADPLCAQEAARLLYAELTS